jgi:putative ABC transport system permease protein
VSSLALAGVRERKGGVIGTFVALFCAAALVCACGLLLVTGIVGSAGPERYAATPVLVSGDQDVHVVTSEGDKEREQSEPDTDRTWIPSSLAQRLAALPDVGSVASEVTFAALLPHGRTSESWGHGWESAALGGFTIAAGRAPQTTDEVVVDADTAASLHLSVGDSLSVLTPIGSLPCHLVGITAQGTADEASIFFDTQQARSLAGHPGMVTAIGVFPRPGTASASADALADEVRSATTGADVVVSTGDDRGAVEFLDVSTDRIDLTSIGGVLGGTSLLVALLVVTGTSSLSVQHRQRELAVLRAVAATPKQIRKLIGGEALLVGSFASVSGAAAGLPLGGVIFHRFVAIGIVPSNLRPVSTVFPPLIAAVVTLVAAWLAARIAARRANRIRPTEALSEAELTPPRISWVRVLFGVLAAAGAATLNLLLTVFDTDAAGQPVSLVGTLLWCAALGLLGPIVARVAVTLVQPVLRMSRVGGFLAGANLRTAAYRVASVLTPIALLVAMASTILFERSTMDRAAQAQVDQGTHADYVIGPRVPADVVSAVAKVPGVQVVTEVMHATVRTNLIERKVTAVTTSGLQDNVDFGVVAGSMAGLSMTTLAVAAGQGYPLGDQVTMTLPDGVRVTLTVVAVYDRQLGFGDFVLDRDLLAPHVDVALDDELLVAAPGVPRSAIATALRTTEPSVSVVDEIAAQAEQGDTVSTQVGYIALALILGFASIAVFNTLAMTVARRAREFASLRLIGATRGQVLSMLRWETLVTVLVATSIGSAIGMSILTAYADGMTGSASPSIPVRDFLAVIATGAAIASVATWLPARAALARR